MGGRGGRGRSVARKAGRAMKRTGSPPIARKKESGASSKVGSMAARIQEDKSANQKETGGKSDGGGQKRS